jgi:O-methyltransferase
MDKIRRWLIAHTPANFKRYIAKFIGGRGNRLSWLIYGKATYNQDGLVSAHNADFMKDPNFVRAYAAGESTDSWGGVSIHWRAHVLCWAAVQASALPEGDFVECGVNLGGSALMVIEYIEFHKMARKFYLLDTFKGLNKEYVTKEEELHGIKDNPWGYVDCYDKVVATFIKYPNVKLIQGTVPETLETVDTEKIAFLAIDMNNKYPEIAAAEYFWDKLVPGALVILDDYGWNKHIEQKRAFDEFARKHNTQILSLPTGQGLLIKTS